MDKGFEEQRLIETQKLLAAQIDELLSGVAKKRSMVTEARDTMWAETHVIRNFDDVAYLNTLLDEVSERERHYDVLNRRLTQLKNMLNAPYFGRIDFTEDGYAPESIYVGIHSLFDNLKQQYAVYDWRAPISSLFYDYGVGKASYTAPDGEINGTITLKRQYKIENGALAYLCDSDLTIDDDILQRELSKSADARIKTIINSIQREQNRAIREEADNLLVFGPAGSGKTSVGLHRLAYLLYRHRGHLTSAGVRIFSANYIFSTYIAGVIPELGEEAVVTLDFKDLLKTYLKRPFLDMYEQIEFLSGGASASNLRRACIALKNNPTFAAFVTTQVKQYKPSAIEDLYFFGTMLCSKDTILDLYADRTEKSTLTTKTVRVMTYVERALDEHYAANKRAVCDIFSEHYDEPLNAQETREKFDEFKSVALGRLYNRLFPNATRMYIRIVKQYVKEHHLDKALAVFTEEALRGEQLLYEDAIMLLYIETITGKAQPDTAVRHILIDEAQDLGYPQHLILRNLFTNCRFTVLADVNQALYPVINICDQQVLTDLYQPATVNALTQSYRSTFAINRFAAQLIGTFDETRYFKRDGDEPFIIDASDVVAAVAAIITELPTAYRSVGVLLPNNREACTFHQALTRHSHTEDIKLIADADDAFASGIVVMTVAYAKGLEFDAVIVPGYGNAFYASESGKRILYLMCTRALHRLYLVRGLSHD